MPNNPEPKIKLRDAGYLTVLSCWRLLSLIPLRVMYVISDLLWPVFYHVIRYRRSIVRRNLTESFPDKSAGEIRRIERRFYRFFADIFFETCKYATISKKTIEKRMAFRNTDEVNELLRRGKSVSVYMGHYCNWEWVSSLPLHLTGERDVLPGQIYHRMSNPTADRVLLRNRSRMGAVCVEMRHTLRWIKEQYDKNITTITGYIADQSPRRREIRHYLKFMNHCVPVLTGAEKITRRYGMEAYYLDVDRIGRGYYRATFVRMADDPASLPENRLTEIYYDCLEKTIRRRPEFFLWSHNRFRYAKTEDEANLS